MPNSHRTAPALVLAIALTCTSLGACSADADRAAPIAPAATASPGGNPATAGPEESSSIPPNNPAAFDTLDSEGLIALVESDLDSIETISINKVDATEDFEQRTTDTVVDRTRSPLAARSTVGSAARIGDT